MKNQIRSIIRQYQEVQNGKLWIGSNFECKFESVNEETVFIRPIENLHSVAEIISHLTLWRRETILKIDTGTGSKTEDCEENWMENDALRKIGWRKIRSDYDKTLNKLIELLATKDDDFLSEVYYDPDFKDYFPYQFIIEGMLHHDIYHLGQLGIIIKFLKM